MLGASIHYPVRGAVTWKSIVGTNVAADALSNLASAGVTGGALIIVGEDYGEGASVIQERTHAFALKSSLWLLDPRPELPTIVRMVEKGFELSEASNTPVMLELRVRACHVFGSFTARNNVAAAVSSSRRLAEPATFSYERLSHPPATFRQEADKIDRRLPAAQKFIVDNKLNETLGPKDGDLGIIVQGGLFNVLNGRLAWPACRTPTAMCSCPRTCSTSPIRWCRTRSRASAPASAPCWSWRKARPDFLEQAIGQILRKADLNTALHGKDMLPRAGEYTPLVVAKGLSAFLAQLRAARRAARRVARRGGSAPRSRRQGTRASAAAAAQLLHRLPRAPRVLRHEAPEARRRPDPRCRRHRLPRVRDLSAVLAGALDPGLRHVAGLRGGRVGHANEAADQRHGRRRLLAQRPADGRGRRRLQQGRLRPRHHEQRLLERDRHAGYSLEPPQRGGARPGHRHRSSAQEPGPDVGEARAHLRRRRRAQDLEAGHDRARQGPAGDHRRRRMPARAPAPRTSRHGEGGGGRRARGAHALLGRSGRVHGRSLLHAPVGLPLAHPQAQRRPAAHRSRRPRQQRLRGMRPVRRGRACGPALPVVRADRHHPESERVGSPAHAASRAA